MLSGLAKTHLQLLNVNLRKFDLWVFVFQLGEMRGDQLAWPAPRRPVVDHDRLGGIDLNKEPVNKRLPLS